MTVTSLASVPRSETTAGRKSALKRGLAIAPASPGGAPGFPVPDAAHWEKARQAIGRVKNPARRAAVARLLRKTAPRFGKTQALKNSWAAPGGNAGSQANMYRNPTDLAGSEFEGTTMTCPACGHSGSASSFGASGTSLDKSPEAIRTPARGNHARRAGFEPGSSGIQVRTGAGGAGLANRRGRTVDLSRRLPVSGPVDVIISRDAATGQAVIRHRQGGAEIARLRRDGDGWVAAVAGRDLEPRAHQRTALMDAVGTWNKTVTTMTRPGMALQGPPQRTPLMEQYGIPAIRALATPAASASGGGRVTLAGGDGGGPGESDDDGLNPRGQGIRDRLKKKGFPHARAVAFAKRAQNTRPGQFGQSQAS